MNQDIYTVTVNLPEKHVGAVTIGLGAGFNFGGTNELTAAEVDALCDELRAAANRVRSHNAVVSRSRWP